MVLTYLEVISGNDGGQQACIRILGLPIDRHFNGIGTVLNVVVL